MYSHAAVHLPISNRDPHKIAHTPTTPNTTPTSQKYVSKTQSTHPTTTPTLESTNNTQELLDRLRQVCEQEGVGYTDDGLEAVIFSAEVR